MQELISKEALDKLSYQSTLGQSLKQISLRKTSIEDILEDISKYRASYRDIIYHFNWITI